jgi:rSAM-associated Gly-rich repeat protein
MAQLHRRQFLKNLLGTLAQGAGTIVLASAAAAPALAQDTGAKDTDIQKRAEGLAGDAGETEDELHVNFINRAFRNGVGGGGFRNGGFRNAGFGGGFRNGGFANGFGGGFRNGAFRNW